MTLDSSNIRCSGRFAPPAYFRLRSKAALTAKNVNDRFVPDAVEKLCFRTREVSGGRSRTLLLVFATLDTQHETANPLNRTAGWCTGWEFYNGCSLSQIMNKELDQVFRQRPALLKPFPNAECLDRRRWGTGSRSLRLAIWTLFDGMLYPTACNFVLLKQHKFLAPT